ncbi:serine/threonine-protein kinase [Nonomuraea dietziae]|uniref:non-specific serine/threonine protein kinase n=2 Tax=Nonomuraea dietziae TaxID=65515 RepID=A0A7W5V3E6_9ACTN|nr:serine/threonine-protein kinase [Nonomuraea dietziae]MBB3727091.1 serine/threonine protein kinase [Nonomuraea dietziae]
MASESDRMIAHRYRLATELGRGGMGVVWEGHDTLLNRPIAVKEVLLPPELSALDRESHLVRTAREARTAAQLNHPSVVAIYDVVEEDGRPWIIMELVRAPSLEEVVATHGALPVREAADVGRQVLSALKAAHEVGILHRDVKPSNVLLCDDGRAVLTDFGIATAEGDSSLTRTGMVTGSPAFLAPERVRALDFGPPSDLWSLGATLYAALIGRSPFERGDPMATLSALMREEPDYRRIPPALHPVLKGLLKKEPDERLTVAQADAMFAELGTPQEARRHREDDDEEPPSRRGSRTTLMAAAAAVLVLTVGAGAYLKFTPSQAEGSARVPQARASTPASAPATSAAPSASSTPTPTTSRTPVALTRPWTSPDGWSIQRPTRWKGARAEAYTQWTRPDRGAHLGVEQQYATLDPHQILRDAEESIQAATGVRTVRRGSVAQGTAEWEFTWTAAAGHPWATAGLRYREVRRATVAGATAFVLSWTVAEDQWRRQGRLMRQVLGSFSPPGAAS